MASKTKNYYKAAYDIQSEIESINEQIAKLNETKSQKVAELEEAIKAGESTGKVRIGGYSLMTSEKSMEKRQISFAKIRELNPSILFTNGEIGLNIVKRHMTPEHLISMIDDPDYEKNYRLSLGELDKICEGKKNSYPYVDTEIRTTIEKKVVRVVDPVEVV